MKKNKGFTLIELLAVIAILAIVLLIAIPTVLNMIDRARIGSFRDSCLSIVKTAEAQAALFNIEEQNLIGDYCVGANFEAGVVCTITAGKLFDMDLTNWTGSITIIRSDSIWEVQLADGLTNGVKSITTEVEDYDDDYVTKAQLSETGWEDFIE